MTTIAEPTGAATPFFNRSGTTISEITIDMSVPVIEDAPMPTGHTVLVATIISGSPSSDRGVRLAPTAEVGDVVEIYGRDLSKYIVHAPSGEQILQSAGTEHFFTTAQGAIKLVKVNSALWAVSR